MPAIIPTLALASASLFEGTWSPISLLFVVCLFFIGLGFAVALLVLLFAGRLQPNPPPEDTPGSGLRGDATTFALPGEDAPTEDDDATSPEGNTDWDEEDDFPSDWAGSLPVQTSETAPEASGQPDANTPSAPADTPAASRPRAGRDTGLWYMLAGLALPVPALVVFNFVDNPAGQMRFFTIGAVLCGGLLAAQIYCLVRAVRAQRNLR